MIRVTVVGGAVEAPALVDENSIQFAGPTGDPNKTTTILLADRDGGILIRESIDQIEQLIKDAKK